MRALQLKSFQSDPELVDLPEPEPGPGEVVIKVGVDGAMAEYLLITDPRRLVPIGDLDPADVAPLTDAGLRPYRAIRKVQPQLTPGSHAVVIGAGRLGHLAI